VPLPSSCSAASSNEDELVARPLIRRIGGAGWPPCRLGVRAARRGADRCISAVTRCFYSGVSCGIGRCSSWPSRICSGAGSDGTNTSKGGAL
jgi:hypothetical protein